MKKNTEPAVTAGSIIAVVNTLPVITTAFDLWTPTPEQFAAVVTAGNVVLSLVLALWTRHRVTVTRTPAPAAKAAVVETPKTETPKMKAAS
jgi:hypothetical protein